VRRVVASFANWNGAVRVFHPELLRVLDMMNLRGEITAELTVSSCTIKGDVSDLGPLRAPQIFQIILSAATHQH
jgi:hypothetical protein